MDAFRFDALSRSLADRHSRRTTLKGAAAGVGAAVLGPALMRPVSAQEATAVSSPSAGFSPDAAFLFVQTATSGSFALNPGAGTPAAEDGTPATGGGAAYLLTLEGHGGQTVFFSDRPDRIFGEAPTEQFLDGLGFAPENPPNAAIVVQTDDGTEDVLIVELLNPEYDTEAGSLTYGATILSEYEGEELAHVAEQQQDERLPEVFGDVSLFIDDCPDIATCYGGLRIRPVGPLPGGPAGACFSWRDHVCVPCSGQSGDYYSNLCNDAYPNYCRSGCVAR